MAVAISVQETTVTQTKDGYDVLMYISDKPRDASDASLALTLRARVPQSHSDRLPHLQLGALDVAIEALKPMMAKLY